MSDRPLHAFNQPLGGGRALKARQEDAERQHGSAQRLDNAHDITP